MSWFFRKYDVFISYSRADKEWVGRLAGDLSSEFRVFLDQAEILAGEQWEEKIRHALENNSGGIVVLSPDSVRSHNVETEWTMLYQRFVQKGIPFVPVLYRECDIPAPLERLDYVDFRGDSHASRCEALDKLRRGLRRRPKSIQRIGSIVLLVFVVVCSLAGLVYALNRNAAINSILRTQRNVRDLESRLSAVISKNMAVSDGHQDYFDPLTNEHVLTDVWQGGRLIRRSFYQRDRLIARDSFIYVDATPTGKTRFYTDASQREFLSDRFGQDGVLIMKRHCPNGLEQDCEVIVDDMRSPLPPPSLMLYR